MIRTPKGTPGQIVQFTMPKDFKDRMEMMARSEGISVSSWCRRVTMDAVRRELIRRGKQDEANRHYRPICEIELEREDAELAAHRAREESDTAIRPPWEEVID